MDWIEIWKIIKQVCDETKDYENIRSDWNLWKAIHWFAIIEASKNIENWLKYLADAIWRQVIVNNTINSNKKWKNQN